MNRASLRGQHATAGELYKYHLGRLDWADQMVANHGLKPGAIAGGNYMRIFRAAAG